MIRHDRTLRVLFLHLQRVALGLVGLVGTATGQAVPMPHPLGDLVATSTEAFGSVSQMVVLSDGRVLIADGTRRLLWRLDATLTNRSIVLDSASGKSNSFSSSSFLMPFRGDSTLFYDRVSDALLVLSPDGNIGRVMAAPAMGAQFLGMWVVADGYGVPGLSRRFGMVFKTGAPVPLPRLQKGDPDTVVWRRDSLYVVSVSIDTRAVDTIAKLSAGTGGEVTITAGPTRQTSTRAGVPTAFAFFDDAVTTTDGSIALLHAQEYRLEWIHPDGARVIGPRLSYPWRPISDDRRQMLADSVNAAQEVTYRNELAKWTADSARLGAIPTTFGLAVSGSYTRSVIAPVPRPAPPRAMRADLLPDYYPPTPRRALRADGDNHVWIRHAPQDGMRGVAETWDIVDHDSKILDRVSIEVGRSVVGFAPGGFVFVTVSDGGTVKVEKRRIR